MTKLFSNKTTSHFQLLPISKVDQSLRMHEVPPLHWPKSLILTDRITALHAGLFLRLLLSYSDLCFQKEKKSLLNTIRVSNSLDADIDQLFVDPDLGQNCLQGYRLSLAGKECVCDQ